MQCYAMLCNAMLCYACYVMLVMLCLLCYACYVMFVMFRPVVWLFLDYSTNIKLKIAIANII